MQNVPTEPDTTVHRRQTLFFHCAMSLATPSRTLFGNPTKFFSLQLTASSLRLLSGAQNSFEATWVDVNSHNFAPCILRNSHNLPLNAPPSGIENNGNSSNTRFNYIKQVTEFFTTRQLVLFLTQRTRLPSFESSRRTSVKQNCFCVSHSLALAFS